MAKTFIDSNPDMMYHNAHIEIINDNYDQHSENYPSKQHNYQPYSFQGLPVPKIGMFFFSFITDLTLR